MSIYQDEISEAEEKKEILSLIIGYLCNINCLSAENYDVLVSNVAQFATKLLKKYDQCVAVLKCTHLFFNADYVTNIELERWKKSLRMLQKMPETRRYMCLTKHSEPLSIHLNLGQVFLLPYQWTFNGKWFYFSLKFPTCKIASTW